MKINLIDKEIVVEFLHHSMTDGRPTFSAKNNGNIIKSLPIGCIISYNPSELLLNFSTDDLFDEYIPPFIITPVSKMIVKISKHPINGDVTIEFTPDKRVDIDLQPRVKVSNKPLRQAILSMIDYIQCNDIDLPKSFQARYKNLTFSSNHLNHFQ